MQEAKEPTVSRASLDQGEPPAKTDRLVQRENKGCPVSVFPASRARRASAVCASRPRLAVDLPASKCLREREASQAKPALRGPPDHQGSGPRANRARLVFLV